MHTFCIKNILRTSAFKQVIQCNINSVNNNNININSQNSFRKYNFSRDSSSILSTLLTDISFKKFHTFSILHDEIQDKQVGKDKKSGLADELLASTFVSDTPPVEDEQTQKQKQEDRERQMRALKFTYIFVGGMVVMGGGLTVWAWGEPQKDEKGNQKVDEFSDMPLIKSYVYRTYSELKNMNRMIQEPSSHKLLPDALTAPYYQPPYTLVLELTDLLVHPEWTYQSGWRFKKRPGVDFLLQHCSPPLFEVVIYTNEQPFTAHPVVDQLDPHNIIWYRIYKDGTRYEEGKHYKDLYCLNRDLNKVIAIDWNKDASTSPRNTLKIKRWDGNMNDSTLVDLAVMIRTIAESDVGDVREVLAYYNTFDDPIAKFKENNRLALEMESNKENDKKPHRKSFIESIARLK